MSVNSLKKCEEIISEYILRNINLPEIDYDLDFFEEGLVNSLFVIELMTFIEKNFSFKIRIEDLNMEYFKSVNSISAFIKRKQEGEKDV